MSGLTTAVNLLDFTLAEYTRLLQTLDGSDWTVLTVREFLDAGAPPEPSVVLRHDVDRRVPNALEMAEREAEHGIAASYYFRTDTFQPDAVRRVAALGHEVGYHYEDLDRADGDVSAAHDSFRENLDRFREHVAVDTVSMHGNPLTPHDNRTMWADGHSFADYGLQGEVYLSVDFTEVTYFSDTNRTWYDEKTIVNDWPTGTHDKPVQVGTTTELIDLVRERRLDRLYLLAHPNRWAGSYPELLAEHAKDEAVNLAKWGLWTLRTARGDHQRPTAGQAQGQGRRQDSGE